MKNNYNSLREYFFAALQEDDRLWVYSHAAKITEERLQQFRDDPDFELTEEEQSRLETMIHDEICEPTGHGIAKDPETLQREEQEAEDSRITIEFLKYASEHDGIREENAYDILADKTYADYLLEEAVNKGLLERCSYVAYGSDLPHYTITQLGRRKLLGR